MKSLFDYMLQTEPGTDLAAAYETLRKATASDSGDVDAAIAEFATRSSLSADIRRKMFQEVIAKRKSAGSVPLLLKHVQATKKEGEAAMAFEAIRPHVGEPHAEALLGLIAATPHEAIQAAAEARMSELIAATFKSKDLSAIVSQAAGKASRPQDRECFKRLLAQCAAREKALAPATPAPKPPAPKPPVAGTPAKPPATPPAKPPATPSYPHLKSRNSSNP
jgi:uncharacterized membrane protein